MKKIIFLLVLAVLITGCGESDEAIEEGETPPELDVPKVSFEDINVEELDNRYNGRVIEKQGKFLSGENEGRTFTMHDIAYTVDGRDFRNYFLVELRPALDWVADNVPEDAVFLNWWDYGHMIRGYTGREVIIYSPSADLLWSLASGKWNVEGSGDFATDEEITDVLFGLLFDVGRTKVVMDKYSAGYVFVVDMDLPIFEHILINLGLYDDISEEERKEKIQESVLVGFLNEEEFEGFELVYSDDKVKIYKKS